MQWWGEDGRTQILWWKSSPGCLDPQLPVTVWFWGSAVREGKQPKTGLSMGTLLEQSDISGISCMWETDIFWFHRGIWTSKSGAFIDLTWSATSWEQQLGLYPRILWFSLTPFFSESLPSSHLEDADSLSGFTFCTPMSQAGGEHGCSCQRRGSGRKAHGWDWGQTALSGLLFLLGLLWEKRWALLVVWHFHDTWIQMQSFGYKPRAHCSYVDVGKRRNKQILHKHKAHFNKQV